MRLCEVVNLPQLFSRFCPQVVPSEFCVRLCHSPATLFFGVIMIRRIRFAFSGLRLLPFSPESFFLLKCIGFDVHLRNANRREQKPAASSCLSFSSFSSLAFGDKAVGKYPSLVVLFSTGFYCKACSQAQTTLFYMPDWCCGQTRRAKQTTEQQIPEALLDSSSSFVRSRQPSRQKIRRFCPTGYF